MALLDSHRVIRLCLVVDECAQIAMAYERDELYNIRNVLSLEEFQAIGLVHSVRVANFSFYRQLVEASRDAQHILCSQSVAFDRKAFEDANRVYEFYSTEQAKSSSFSPGANRRICRILRFFRKIARLGLHTQEAQRQCTEKLRLDALRARDDLQYMLESHNLDLAASDDGYSDSTDDEDVVRCDDLTDDDAKSEDGESVE